MSRLQELLNEQVSLERQLDNSRNHNEKVLQRLLAVEVEIALIEEDEKKNGTCKD